MQNEFLPEETSEYRLPAPITQPTESTPAMSAAASKSLTSEERATLLRWLKRRYKGRTTAKGNLFAATLLLVTTALILVLLNFSDHKKLLLVVIPIGAAFGLKLMDVWEETRRPLLTTDRLKEIESAEAVGSLLDMLRSVEMKQDREEIYTALAQCLRHIQSDVSVSLTPRQHGTLRNRLLSSTDLPASDPVRLDFCIATLKALEQIGDKADVPVVEKIAAMDARNPDSQRIKEAANECLPLLKIRAGLVAESKTLLRASAPENDGGGTLLRAATGPDDAKPDELLRPSDGGA